MINESQPLDGPAEITRFGNPWHGPVQGGILTLPTGGSVATKPWPQPAEAAPRTQVLVECNKTGLNDANGIAYGSVIEQVMFEPDIAGFTHALSPDDAPAEPLAADLPSPTDPAKQWRRSALLSGANQQLYGNPLNGWIWCSAPAVRHRVVLNLPAGAVDMTVPLVLTATRERFGINMPAGSETVSATLSNWRQYGAGDPLLLRNMDSTFYDNLNGNCANCETCTPAADVANPVFKKGRLTLYAVSPTGDRALIEISPATMAGTYEFTNLAYEGGHMNPFICRHPIGWLLVTMTPGGMTVSAILSRGETFGSVGSGPESAWSGYKLMGFFRPNGDIGWFSWSGSTITGSHFTRLTRLDASLTPTADYIEIIPPPSSSAYTQFQQGFEAEADPFISFYAATTLGIRVFRIGNGAIGFLKGQLEVGVPQTTHTQVLTTRGVKTIPAQNPTWAAAGVSLSYTNGPRFSSYNHVTDEVSPLWQTSPICWV